MTTTTTLTDRYVDAVLRRVPAHQRADIEKELRASIADAVEDRVTAGADLPAAENEVLTELGDPDRLAANYADRPLHLIGPALFLDYKRLLTVLLVTVVPIVTLTVGISQVMQSAVPGHIIGSVLGAAITTAVHVAFWTTLAFAALERTPARYRKPLPSFPGGRRALGGLSPDPWTPADLPEPPNRRARFGELIGESVWLAIFLTLLFLSPVVSPEHDANGDPITILAPWLWDSGVVYVFVALVIAHLGLAFARYYAPRNLRVLVAGSAADIASAAVIIWLAANDRVLNPAFTAAAGWSPEATRWTNAGLAIVAAGTILKTAIDAVLAVRRR